MIRLLFLGDIVGEMGRKAVRLSLPEIKETEHIDFTVVNGENASRGRGLNHAHYQELLDMGVDAITLGNHYRSDLAIDHYIDTADRLMRPLNLLRYNRGVGSRLFTVKGVPVRVTNVMGAAFMAEKLEAPHISMRRLLQWSSPCVHLVDMHAESTSEKLIFAHLFDGQVSAVLGTHTHVPTADARILPKGTAFINDVGFCGDDEGVIGVELQSALDRTLSSEIKSYSYRSAGRAVVSGCVVEVDEKTYLATKIYPIQRIVEVE